nr:hypothetical protein [uncultured Campylobacter sp.]
MAKFKFFAILAALCLGLNLSASEIEGRWSIVSVTAQGQTFKTAGQKCLEDSFIEASGDNARLSLSSAGSSSCEKAEQNFALKSLGGGRYSLGGGELRLNNGSLEYKQGTDSGEIVFTFKKDEVNLAGIVNDAVNQAGLGGSNLSEIEGRWELVSLKAQGQSFKVAGQKCFGDSFFEIGGDEATVGIVGVNPDGSCNKSAGKSGYESLGGGKYALSAKGLGEFWLKDGMLEYKQVADGQEVLFVFKKSTNSTQAKASKSSSNSAESAKPAKDPSVKHSSAGASKKGSGVFGGTKFNMLLNTSEDYSFYLRDDSTYASRLEKPDWRTRIDGTYKVKDGILTITSNDDYDTSYYCENDDCTFLWNSIGTGYYMFQAQISSQMPKECFSFRKDSSSSMHGWSGGSDTVSVGVSGYYCFDGKGRFSSGGSSYAMATSGTPGGSIDGGSSKSRSDEGSYKLNQGELTLRYDDGTVVRHSFFYTLPRSKDNKAMAIIDGEVYR